MLEYNIAKWIRFCVCVHLENIRYNLNKAFIYFYTKILKPQKQTH